MPTLAVPIEDGQIIVDAVLRVPANGPRPGAGSAPVTLRRALMDTGAQRTGISPGVISDLGLLQIDTGRMLTATGGIEHVPIYVAQIAVSAAPEGTGSDGAYPVYYRTLPVSGLPFQPWNFDVLLGMDVLSACHITLGRGQALVST